MTTDTELMLDVGQANELKLAARRCGYTNADLKLLSEGDTMARILPVLRGQAEVTIVNHVIDLDAPPLIPYDGWSVEEHKPGGQFKWDPTKINLYLSPNQQGGKSIEGHKLRAELVNQPVMNANLLDYLLAHPHLIPEDWKRDAEGNTRFVHFWGTIYRNSGRDLCVRYLFWDGGRWQAGCNWLGSGWPVRYPAARLAN